jgi:fructuronate reductase
VTLPRLSLAAPGPAALGPAVDPLTTGVGIVHLGVGAFHRAHQAVFTEDAAAAAGDDRWGIMGVSQRSARVVEQLRPQDGLYGVLTKGSRETSLRIIGSMRDVAFLRSESQRVLAAIAAPTTHVVTLTVSEKGYRRAASAALDLADADLAADLAALRRDVAGRADDAPARTPVGALTRGLARRFATGAPITIVCCDNMVDNGRIVAGLVASALDATPGAGPLRDWIATSVRFPVTMVDRITPATSAANRAEAATLLGLRDEGLVVGEPFSQWVIEDSFAGPRPAWELAGATLTRDVTPFERAKLRLLNGTHSTIAYLGALRGHRTIDEAMQDLEVLGAALSLMDEVEPTLGTPQGLDLARYRAEILERFDNPNIGYTTLQVASDGSQKLPIRVLGTVADRLAAGAVPEASTRAMAAWAVFVARGRDRNGQPLPLDDPMADRLHAAATGDDTGLADRMLELAEVFPAPVREHDGFRQAFRHEVAELLGQVP